MSCEAAFACCIAGGMPQGSLYLWVAGLLPNAQPFMQKMQVR